MIFASLMSSHIKGIMKLEMQTHCNHNLCSNFKNDTLTELLRDPVIDSRIFLSANLGGSFGLFLGMSILTVLEFIDLAFRRIYFTLLETAGRRRVREQ